MSMQDGTIDPEQSQRFENFMARQEKRRANRRQRTNEIASKWGQLPDDLLRELEESLPNYAWRTEGLFSQTRMQKVDILGVPTQQGRAIAIELERDRSTCVRNIIKIWMQMDQQSRNFQLIQVFSPVYLNEKKTWREEAEFVGARAAHDTAGKLSYESIQMPIWPT